jgi:hypothetical protein
MLVPRFNKVRRIRENNLANGKICRFVITVLRVVKSKTKLMLYAKSVSVAE